MIKTIFDFVFLTALYIGGIFTLNTDALYVVTIAGSSIAGSVVLAYYRRDRDYKEIFFKSACASICGLVVGAVITRWKEIDFIEYTIAIYFFASLLSLFFIKGLLAFAEQNASGMIVTIWQRVIGIQGDRGAFPRVIPDGSSQVIKTEILVQKDGHTVDTTETPKE
jgi:uncharacterized membrane protein YfcA